MAYRCGFQAGSTESSRRGWKCPREILCSWESLARFVQCASCLAFFFRPACSLAVAFLAPCYPMALRLKLKGSGFMPDVYSVAHALISNVQGIHHFLPSIALPQENNAGVYLYLHSYVCMDRSHIYGSPTRVPQTLFLAGIRS